SAALPSAIAFSTAALIWLVVVSKVGTAIVELNFAVRLTNSWRLPSAMGLGAGTGETLRQPARIEAKARNDINFQRIMIACKLLAKEFRSSGIERSAERRLGKFVVPPSGGQSAS